MCGLEFIRCCQVVFIMGVMLVSKPLFLLLHDLMLATSLLLFFVSVVLVRQVNSYFIVVVMMLSNASVIHLIDAPLLSFVETYSTEGLLANSLWYSAQVLIHILSIFVLTRLHYTFHLSPQFAAYVLVICYFITSVFYAGFYFVETNLSQLIDGGYYTNGVILVQLSTLVLISLAPLVIKVRNYWVESQFSGGYRKWRL